MPVNFDDFDTDFSAQPVAKTNAEEIRANAHIANGGDASFACPECRGSGKFYSYTGRLVGNCFKCKGRGKVTGRVVAAAKGRETKAKNAAEWAQAHAAELEFVRYCANQGSAFYSSLLESVTAYGKLSEKQLAAVHNGMAKADEKRAQRKAEAAAVADAKSGVVSISAIEALFATATDNDIKRPVFRAEAITLSKAPANGRNAGALYVVGTEDKTYLGKIVNGQFMASRDATNDTLGQLQAIAADPTSEAIKYARRTSNCSCCGKQLVDPVSIRAGIGPICADKWGLDFLRDSARDSLAND